MRVQVATTPRTRNSIGAVVLVAAPVTHSSCLKLTASAQHVTPPGVTSISSMRAERPSPKSVRHVPPATELRLGSKARISPKYKGIGSLLLAEGLFAYTGLVE